MDVFRFTPGESPVLLSIPHVGTHIPEELATTMTAAARVVPDTDWHLDRLYDFAPMLGVGCIAARHSRYVVDLNRDPGGALLYPGRDNTELCPTMTFDRQPIYRPGGEPDASEIEQRVNLYWRPYHARLAEELGALRARHGIAVLFDAHSIRSRVPRLFAGRLPDFNLGTADGRSATPALAAHLMRSLSADNRYSVVLDGRFKGGFITRQYGRPEDNVYAVQLELSQITYMEETHPFRFHAEAAARVRPILEAFVASLVSWARETAGKG